MPLPSSGRVASIAALGVATLLALTPRGAPAAGSNTAIHSLEHAVAVDGDYAIVGARWQDGFRGSAHILKRAGDRWVVVQTLSPDDLGTHDQFGAAVAIEGDIAVVGAPWQGLFRGAAYVYRRSGDRWELQQKLTAADAAPEDRFGGAVSVDNGVLGIGRGTTFETGAGTRDVTEFTRSGTKWNRRGVTGAGSFDAIAGATVSVDDASAVAVVETEYGAAPAPRAPPDPPDYVVASDGAFEDRVDVSWASVNLDAILYKVLRDGVLLSVASSQDTLYQDTTGNRGQVYSYCVTVVDMVGDESVPQCDDGSRILMPPRKVAATDGLLIDGVQVTWEDRSLVEAGYHVRRDGTLVATLAANAKSYMDPTAVPGTVYSYDVRAFDDAAAESTPGVDTGFRGFVLPPLDVSASDGEYIDGVHITWTDPTAGTGQFIITRTPTGGPTPTVLDTVPATAYTDFTAQSGVRYAYCVTTLDAGQESVPICDDGGIDLPVPANVQASDSTYDDHIEITWDDVSALEDGYEISRDGVVLDTTRADAESYKDFDAQPNQTYTYCVVALNDNGGASAPACDTGYQSIVLAPTNVQASDGTFENRVRVTWESSSTTVVLFKLFRGGTFVKSLSAGARLYDDTGGTAGQTYTYAVQAVTAQLDQSVPGTDDGYRELRAPTGVAASDDEFEDRVEITWTDRSAIESGYAVYREDTATTVVDTLGEVGAGSTSFTDRTGAPGTTYRYRVAAFDTKGEGRGESDTAADYGIRTLLAPRSVDAGDGEFEKRVDITWTDESAAEDGYAIYRNGVQIGSTPDNTTSFSDLNPVFDARSEYAVRAFDMYGTSEAAADSGSTMLLAPASFNASDDYFDKIVLRWVDVSEIEDGYVLTVDSLDTTVRSFTLAPNTTSFTDTAAKLVTAYDYHLHAFKGTARSATVTDTGYMSVNEVTTPAVTVDQRIAPGDGAGNDRYGTSVVTTGDELFVGSPQKLGGGAAYVFGLNSDLTWSQKQKLTGADQKGGDRFGEAIAVSGDHMIIGLPGRNSDYQNQVGRSGLALVFTRGATDGVWFEQNVFRPTGESPPDYLPEDDLDQFGSAVAIDGGVAAIGAPGDDSGQAPNLVHEIGSMYIFTMSTATNWVRTSKFFPSDGEASDQFGKSVGISGDWIIVGAPGDNDRGAGSGSAYFFHKSGTQWTEYSKIIGSGVGQGSAFGASVAISGDIAFVGAPQNSGQLDGPGRVYVFVRDARTGVWNETQMLTRGGDTVFTDGFGISLALHGKRILVGEATGAGSAHVFIRDGLGVWDPTAVLAANDGTVGDAFGSAVALGDEWAFAGASLDDVGNATNIGSVYALYFVATVSDVVASDGGFDDRVHITWTDHSMTEEGVIIYRDGVEYDRLGPNASFYDDFDAEPGRTYEYQVSAINQFAGFEADRVPDFGWRPPNGNISGSITSVSGAGVAGASVCLEPPPTRALLFDGVGGHVRIPDDGTFNFNVNESFTIETWFSYSGSDRSPRLISKLAKPGTQERPIDLGLQRSGRVFFTMSDGANVARVMSQRGDLNDDTWHHVACVHDATARSLRLYVDGVEEASTSTAALGDVTNTSDVFIGGNGPGTWYGGQMDELRIWKVARSATQISTMRTVPLQGDENGLVGYWPMDAFSGATITDFAGVAQYGTFVDGVYRTNNVAPLDACVDTDTDGNFVLSRIRYAENGTDFKLRPSLGNRQFSPAVQPVTLNNGHPVENQVRFSDVSSHTIAGVVRFQGTNCFIPDVEIRVDGSPAGGTDKNGKFSVAVDDGSHSIRARLGDHTFWTVFDGTTFKTDSITIDVHDDIDNFLFLDTTTSTVGGNVGGGCDHYVGEVTVRFRSENNCLDTTFVGNPSYTLDLPPQTYFASATVDPATVPPELSRSDVVQFFENLGEREVNLEATTDTTLDFVYRAPLRVTISGFEPYVDTNCRLELEDGTLLPPGLPVVPQLEYVDVTIHVEEDYGNTVCPLDSGQVVVFDEIFDQEDTPDTLTVTNGVATYQTFASTPSLVRGRTEGGKDRSFQKALVVNTRVPGRTPVSATQWVLVTGHVAPEGANFITVPTMEVPLFVLRDPPGDGSYAYLEKETSSCFRVDWSDWTVSGALGGGWEIKAGATTKAFVGLGAGIITAIRANGVTKGKLLAGVKYSSETSMDLCFTTKERFSTSASDDYIGSGGDLYVGAGITYLFSEVGVISLNGCVVEQSTSVGFEPDEINTTFNFTEKHITDELIPELQSKADYYRALGDTESTQVFEIMRDQWQEYVDLNHSLKKEAVVTENRSFSAGAEFEYTHTVDTTTAWSSRTVGFAKFDAEAGFEFGPEGVAHFYLYGAINSEDDLLVGWTNGDSTSTWSVGYVLSDDDPGDAFTVDLKDDGSYRSPVFAVRGGKSSCPYEPWPDLDTGAATMVPRDKPKLFIDPNVRFGVPPDEPATFKLTIANLSDEQRTYTVSSLSNSNPGGAILRLNGSPVADGLNFVIDGVGGANSHEATLEVERGPTRFNYDNLRLVVAPECGGDGATTDSLSFSVSFEGCSNVRLSGPDVVPGWTYNRADSAAGRKMEFVLDRYELASGATASSGLESLGIQYRRLGSGQEGPGPWTDIIKSPPGIISDISSDGSPDTVLTWRPDSLANGAYLPLLDGVYELRAFTECVNGGRGYSDTSVGTIDRHAPTVFGTPEPADRQLSLGEDISVTFNEPIACTEDAVTDVAMKYLDGPSAGAAIAVDVVCNGSTLVVAPLADPADMEGRRLEATVSGVRDPAGNVMTGAVTWEFEYRKSLFTWAQTRLVREVALGNPGTVAVDLANGTPQSIDYTITEVPAFLTITPGEGTGQLAAGGIRTVTFAVDDALAGGSHSGQVTAIGTDATGTDTLGVAVMDVHLDVACTPPVWSVNPGAFEYSMAVIAQVELGAGGPKLTGPGDRLAAFVGNELRGVATPAVAGADTLLFLTVYSNRVSNETVHFEVWDDDQCRWYSNTEQRLPFTSDDVIGSTAAPALLTAVGTLPATVGVFKMDSGWNWFSTNVVSADMSVVNVLSSLSPSTDDIIKSSVAFAVFDSTTPTGWVGTLTTLDNTSGYMLRLADAGTIYQEGTPVDPSVTPVPIDNGWNWIGYLPSVARSVPNALQDLDTQSLLLGGEVVKGRDGFAQWDVNWLGNLNLLEPGHGYRLFLQNGTLPGTFAYPPNPAAAPVIAGLSGAHAAPITQGGEPNWRVETSRFQYNMTMIATLESGGVESRSGDDLVAAFVGDECRGVGRLMHVDGIDRYLAFLMIHGNESDGGTVEFRVYNAAEKVVYDVDGSVEFRADASSGSVGEPFALTTTQPHMSVPTVFRLYQNHPNPFNPQTTIRFDLPRAAQVSVRIYDVRGQLVNRLVDRTFPPGVHSVVWDGATSTGGRAASGVYFYELKTTGFRDVKKMLLLK